MKHLIIIIAIATCFAGCNPPSGKEQETQHLATIKYATGFRIAHVGNAKRVDVVYPYKGATSGYSYLLVNKGEPVPDHTPDVKVIFTPVSSIVCTSTTHIPLLDYLNESEKLVGFPTTDYISSEKMRALIDAGYVEELGAEKGMNIEKLAVLKPEMVMSYTMTADFGQLRKVEELGIPVIINAEYLEEHPLGRAEWIKFMALFFNKEQQADSVFTYIENEYNQTKALAGAYSTKPTALSGVVYGDVWYMPGGQNYGAKLLNDAGYQYLWASDSSKGSIQLSFEAVYEKAHAADCWIGVASFTSLQDLQNADQRYAKFKAFQQQQVYSYNARKGAKGGSEFLELGYLRPDLILKDLVKIAHSEALPGYSLYFHKQLQ